MRFETSFLVSFNHMLTAFVSLLLFPAVFLNEPVSDAPATHIDSYNIEELFTADSDTFELNNHKEVGLYVGKGHWLRIRGHVHSILQAESLPEQPMFIDITGQHPNNPFSVVIFSEDQSAFPSVAERLKDRDIEIVARPVFYIFQSPHSGKTFQRITFVLRDPSQLRVLK